MKELIIGTKINLNEIEIVLPRELENSIAVSEHLKSWSKLVKESEIQKLKESRIKKLNEINAKIK
jgi:hypothetical protein